MDANPDILVKQQKLLGLKVAKINATNNIAQFRRQIDECVQKYFSECERHGIGSPQANAVNEEKLVLSAKMLPFQIELDRLEFEIFDTEWEPSDACVPE
jgi:hypothetical protein